MKGTLADTIDKYPKSKTGKIAASNLLVITAAHGTAEDLEKIIKKYDVTAFQKDSIKTAVAFSAVALDTPKLIVFAHYWEDMRWTIFSDIFSFAHSPHYYWDVIMFPDESRAYHFMLENTQFEEWPSSKETSRSERLACAADLMRNGVTPDPGYLSYEFAKGKFDFYHTALEFGYDIDLSRFDYMYSPNADNPKFYPSAGSYFYNTLQSIDEPEQQLYWLEYVVSKIENAGFTPIITTNMISRGVAEFLFSANLQSYTLQHYDFSHVRKSEINKLKKMNTTCE